MHTIKQATLLNGQLAMIALLYQVADGFYAIDDCDRVRYYVKINGRVMRV